MCNAKYCRCISTHNDDGILTTVYTYIWSFTLITYSVHGSTLHLSTLQYNSCHKVACTDPSASSTSQLAHHTSWLITPRMPFTMSGSQVQSVAWAHKPTLYGTQPKRTTTTSVCLVLMMFKRLYHYTTKTSWTEVSDMEPQYCIHIQYCKKDRV